MHQLHNYIDYSYLYMGYAEVNPTYSKKEPILLLIM